MDEKAKKYFNYERSTRYIFNDFYKEQGYLCKRVYGKENKKYDCFLRIKDKWHSIEEKMRRAKYLKYQDFLIETIQDIETNTQGWLYETEAKTVLYAFDNKTIYSLSVSKLRKIIEEYEFEKRISRKGWGVTENVVIPFYIAFGERIGKLICDEGKSLIECNVQPSVIEEKKEIIPSMTKEEENEILEMEKRIFGV